MTDQAAHRKPSLRSGLAVALVTTLLGLLVLEGGVRWIFRSPYQWDHRLMFFSEGHNFRNTDWGGFTYQPSGRVRSQTYYLTNTDPPEVRLEYGYEYSSNAQGLVQLHDLTPSKPAILFLGDSFTEGQGARPWFYELERAWSGKGPHQLVNGGILGTGVEGWGRLYRQLSSEVPIARVVIIFISEDWTRPVEQFPRQTLTCLRTAAECIGNEGFYGLPEDPVKARAHIDRIARYRIDSLARLRQQPWYRRSAAYQKVVAPVFRRLAGFRETGSMKGEAARQFEVSKRVATDIVASLGRGNVLFIYLPQKHELASGPTPFGRKAADFIQESGFPFVDGRTECGLSLGDYYEHDGHPNAAGYARIGACVQRVVDGAFHVSEGAVR